MKTFIIEREIPGASQLSEDELRGIAKVSNSAMAALDCEYEWVTSYVAGDKIYCVHAAPDSAAILEHARCGGFPANKVTEVANVFDGSWGS